MFYPIKKSHEKTSTDHLLIIYSQICQKLTMFSLISQCTSAIASFKNIFEEGLEISSVWSSKNAKMWLMISTYLNAD